MPLFDKKDKSRYTTFTRRAVGMGGAMTAVFAVLAGRLSPGARLPSTRSSTGSCQRRSRSSPFSSTSRS